MNNLISELSCAEVKLHPDDFDLSKLDIFPGDCVFGNQYCTDSLLRLSLMNLSANLQFKNIQIKYLIV